MRPIQRAQASHRSNATADQSLTLEETFARTSKRGSEKGTSSFQSQPHEPQRLPSSATLSSGRMMSSRNVYMMNHSLSYTSHNGLEMLGEDFSKPPHSDILPPMHRTHLQHHNSHRRGLPPASSEHLGRGNAILEDQSFHSPRSNPTPQRANVPPLIKLEPHHFDVSAPSRRCLHKHPGPVMVTGSDRRLQPENTSRMCLSCQMQMWAPKTAIVVRCPQCQTVNSEAMSAFSMQ